MNVTKHRVLNHTLAWRGHNQRAWLAQLEHAISKYAVEYKGTATNAESLLKRGAWMKLRYGLAEIRLGLRESPDKSVIVTLALRATDRNIYLANETISALHNAGFVDVGHNEDVADASA